MSWVAVGVAGTQLASSFFAAENSKASAELTRDIAEMNAEFAEIDSHNAKLAGYDEVTRYQKVVDDTLAEQRTNLAAADVDLSFGSAAEIQKETQFIAELNKMEMIKQAEENALGYKNEARQYRMQGSSAITQGSLQAGDQLSSGLFSAINTGLSGYRG